MENFLFNIEKLYLITILKENDTMNQAAAKKAEEAPYLFVFRVGFGTPLHNYADNRHKNPLYEHLPTLEKEFGVPFYLAPFNWQYDDIASLRSEHAGKYRPVAEFAKEHYELSQSVLDYLNKHYKFDFPIGVSIYEPR